MVWPFSPQIVGFDTNPIVKSFLLVKVLSNPFRERSSTNKISTRESETKKSNDQYRTSNKRGDRLASRAEFILFGRWIQSLWEILLVRFAPKGPPRRVQKPVVPKIEKTETIDADAQAQELLRRFNEASGKVKPKVEKKVASTQIAFGYGGQSNSIKSYGALKAGIGVNNDGGGGAYSSVLGDQKEYKEPWDYYSYYPITLPLRRPYSGNPELLNEEEFREASENVTYDEIRPANDLGLQEENLEARIFFLQLPANMPILNQSANAEGQEMVNNSEPPKSAGPSKKGCSLDELPGGFMGKMLVYKSGAVKLKLGDIIYDVSAGSDSVFAQDVVAINTEEKHCCVVGELSQRAVITPDVDSILNSISDL